METNGNINHVDLILNFLDIYDKSSSKYSLNGRGVTIADVANVSRGDFHDRDIEVKVSKEVQQCLRENALFLGECLDKKMVVYGVNTGFGGSADVRNEDILAIQKSLILQLNCGSLSQQLDVGHVRSTMFIRANSLSWAYSGVRPEVVELLCQMINKDIVPQVPMRGSVSASGDLLHLSYVAATMCGEKKGELVYHKGKLQLTAERVFEECNLKFIEFQAKEALAVINSASCASTLAAINLFDFGCCLFLTEIITAMVVESLRGRMETFHPTVCNGLPHSGIKEFSEVIKRLLQDSKLARHDLDKTQIGAGELAQDRYALRTSPQWMSPSIETFKESVKKVTVELNSSNDNPLIDHLERAIIHCGNFQGSSTTVAMDQTRQSVQMCGRMIFAQITELLNHHMNGGLPPNLSGSDYSKDLGFKGIDLALASYTSELEYLAGPMTNHMMSAEMHNQSINSMALVSARKTAETLDLLRLIVASSLLSLCQAVDLRWLQSQVSKAWNEVAGESAVFGMTVENQKWHWYDAAFRFDIVRGELEEKFSKLPLVNGQNAVGNKLFSSLLEKFRSKVAEVVSTLSDGSHVMTVSETLGIGTRKMYSYIRNDLKVPFYNGKEALDKHLEKILDVLRKREILGLLTNIFRC